MKQPSRSFVHPGLLTGRDDVEFIRARLAAKDQPWTDAFELLAARREEYLNHTPSPHKRYVTDPHQSRPGPARDLLLDARSIYANTLLFVFTGDARHAARAEETIHAWTDVEIVPDADHLLATSYSWPAIIWSAELLRDYHDWPAQRRQRFDQTLRETVAPVVWQKPHVNNNWLSWAICCRMACAVYLDDSERFDQAVEQYKWQLENYIEPDGSGGELTRDLWHNQMGMAPLLLCAEFAWRQGVDLYGPGENRLLKGVEFHVPFIDGDYSDWPRPDKPPVLGVQEGRQKWWDMYELAYNHYHNRMQLSAPNIERIVLRRRPEPFWRMGWGTLMHNRPKSQERARP